MKIMKQTSDSMKRGRRRGGGGGGGGRERGRRMVVRVSNVASMQPAKIRESAPKGNGTGTGKRGEDVQNAMYEWLDGSIRCGNGDIRVQCIEKQRRSGGEREKERKREKAQHV